MRQCFSRRALPVIKRWRMPQDINSWMSLLDAGDWNCYGRLTDARWFSRHAANPTETPSTSRSYFLGLEGAGDDPARPTFVGPAGTEGAYFGFGGSQYFKHHNDASGVYGPMHKAGAIWTVMTWLRLGAFDVAQAILGTQNTVNSPGMSIRVSTSGGVNLVIGNGSVNQQIEFAPAGALTTGTWHFVALAIEEGIGAHCRVDNQVWTPDHDYTNPSSSDPSERMEIGARGDHDGAFLLDGARMAMMLIFYRLRLPEGDIARFYQATRGRFGV